MGLGAIRCEGTSGIGDTVSSAGGTRASDFSGKDILGYAAVMAAITAVSGCVSYLRQNDDSAVTETKRGVQHPAGGGSPVTGAGAQVQNESYPFDIHADTDSLSPFFGKDSLITADDKWKGPAHFKEAGDVEGIYSKLTNTTYWIEFRGIGQGETGAKLAHYNVYRVDPSGAVEKQQVDLESAPFSEQPEATCIEAEYRKNPRLCALLDFQGDDESRPDLRLIMANQMTAGPYVKVIASEVKASEVKQALEEFEKRSSQWQN